MLTGTEAIEAMTNEYDWIVKSVEGFKKEAQQNGSLVNSAEVYNTLTYCRFLISELKTEEGFSQDFEATMESLKGQAGHLMRLVRAWG